MLSRSIACSLLLVAGCSNTNDTGPAPSKIMKVTYLRFQLDPQTKRYVPQYRVMISQAWRDKYGDNPNEPLAKLFRRGSRSPFLGEVPDEMMERLLHELSRKGMDKMAWKRPEDIDLVAIAAAEKDDSKAQWTRIITIGNDTESRSYSIDVGNAAVFSACEREVIKVAVAYTAQVTTETMPVIPK